MNCVRFVNVMNNTTIIKNFTRDNRNIADFKTQHGQIMTTIANGISKFETMIKISIVADNTFFTTVTFSRINSLV